MNIQEIAEAFGASVESLNTLAGRYQIRPACRIGNMPVYGPEQVRRFADALRLQAVDA